MGCFACAAPVDPAHAAPAAASPALVKAVVVKTCDDGSKAGSLRMMSYAIEDKWLQVALSVAPAASSSDVSELQ